MGMIEQEYKELRALLAAYKAGEVDEKQVNTQISIFSQMEKRQKSAIQIQALAVKANNNKPIKNLTAQNIIGNQTTIDLSLEERENETIRCTITDRIISRSHCLDYSGKHMDECEPCHHFKLTRELLLNGEGQLFMKTA